MRNYTRRVNSSQYLCAHPLFCYLKLTLILRFIGGWLNNCLELHSCSQQLEVHTTLIFRFGQDFKVLLSKNGVSWSHPVLDVRLIHSIIHTIHPSAGHVTWLASFCTTMTKMYCCTWSGGHVTWEVTWPCQQDLYCTALFSWDIYLWEVCTRKHIDLSSLCKSNSSLSALVKHIVCLFDHAMKSVFWCGDTTVINMTRKITFLIHFDFPHHHQFIKLNFHDFNHFKLTLFHCLNEPNNESVTVLIT